MSIEEAKTKQTELEKNILDLIWKFQRETNCDVEKVSLGISGEDDYLCKVFVHVRL